jgi:hypothetical protein
MPPPRRPDPARQAQIQAELKRDREIREKSYRERALNLFPPVCGSCGREFSGKRLRELTVHHRDHNHNNNPPDGSNWELLCLYCHDNEHEKFRMKGFGGVKAGAEPQAPALGNPFDALDNLLGSKPDESQAVDDGHENDRDAEPGLGQGFSR